MLDFETFKKEISSLKTVYSVRDQVPYDIIDVTDTYLTVLRKSTHKGAKVNLQGLYDFYAHETEYTTSNAKKPQYKLNRVQSPAVGLILALISKIVLPQRHQL